MPSPFWLLCAPWPLYPTTSTPPLPLHKSRSLFSLYHFTFTDLQFDQSFTPFFYFLFLLSVLCFPDVGVEHQLVSETAQWQWRGNSCLFLFLVKHNILFRSWVLQDFFLFAFSLQSPSDLGSCVNLRIFVAFHYIMDCHQI